MKTKTILFLMTILLLLVMPVLVLASQELPASDGSRNIYVGDIIRLEISGGFSYDEIREKFGDFDIVEMKEESGKYLLSLRTFETGEYRILLGDKEIIINVASTLEDFEREDIFEGGTQIIESGFSFNWRIFFFIAAGIFLLSGGYIILKAVLKKKPKDLNSYQLFIHRSGALSVSDEDYFVNMTRYFKEFIEGMYQCRIIGKTSVETLNELKKIQPLADMLPVIYEWLEECDRLKFTGVNVSNEKKQEYYGKLFDLAENINLRAKEAQKEGVA